jgi:arsenate reductase
LAECGPCATIDSGHLRCHGESAPERLIIAREDPIMSPVSGSAPGGHSPLPSAFVTAPPKRVVFLCVHNAGLSQIAEAIARTMAPADTQIWSAGVEPAPIHPLAVRVMKEMGIDLSGQHSKHVDEVPWREADTIVAVCAQSVNIFPDVEPAVRRVHWPLPDPKGETEAERLASFRAMRDEIRWRVSSLWPSGD